MSMTSATLHGLRLASGVFVETGSQKGDGIQFALDSGYSEIYSVDTDVECARECRRRFLGDWRVEIYHGDSVEFLRDLVQILPNPCVFWLDAHPDYSSPILQELQMMVEHAVCDEHTILIDDRRLMHGCWAGIHESEVIAVLKEINPAYQISLRDGYDPPARSPLPDDIIVARIH